MNEAKRDDDDTCLPEYCKLTDQLSFQAVFIRFWNIMMNGGFPENAVASQFGVDLKWREWDVSFSSDSPTTLHITMCRHRRDEPEHARAFTYKLREIMRVIDGKKLAQWRCNVHGYTGYSFQVSVAVPKSLEKAYQNYMNAPDVFKIPQDTPWLGELLEKRMLEVSA